MPHHATNSLSRVCTRCHIVLRPFLKIVSKAALKNVRAENLSSKPQHVANQLWVEWMPEQTEQASSVNGHEGYDFDT